LVNPEEKGELKWLENLVLNDPGNISRIEHVWVAVRSNQNGG